MDQAYKVLVAPSRSEYSRRASPATAPRTRPRIPLVIPSGFLRGQS